MTDYAKLIDAQTWAFVERTNAYYPPETIDYTIDRQREIYDRMCREFFAGYPDGVTAKSTAILTQTPIPTHEIPVRIYRAGTADNSAVVIYFHGGGFVVGGLESHDDVCAELCHHTGFEVVSVDYRLAPEHRHPADFDDAMNAFEWVATNYASNIVLCGDSAGGNLAAAVSHATRVHARRSVGQVLIYPALGGDESQGSYLRHAEAPMLTAREVSFYAHIRSGGQDRTGDATMAPLADTNFENLPATVVFTAECDPLSSDGEAYRDRLVAAGGRALWIEEPGLVHGYLRARHSVGRARASFTRIVDAVHALGHGEWLW